VPNINRQVEIVEKLDTFSKLNGDIKDGLPAEISMREKQYDYYRDKLLTFKEKN
jgi:type I restriction enzyme S subunit